MTAILTQPLAHVLDSIYNDLLITLGYTEGFESLGLLILCIPTAIVLFFLTFCLCGVFDKIGISSWKAFIPFYRDWNFSKHIWGNGLFSLIGVLSTVGCVIYLGQSCEHGLSALAGLSPTIVIVFWGDYLANGPSLISLIPIISGIFSAFTLWKMYTCFGKSTKFKIAGIILPVIAITICAFGKSTFVKPTQK